ncbi:SNF2 family N-terminal domain-containing protein [Gaertneriomyces semiglobifer]|nr:SNF2 family N-terminal domain-containing protein [Gaertneriomyces semiglobifer]
MYLVKWQGRSYRELCWCPLEHLRTCKGFKKIEKFIKEFNEREAILEDPTLPDEDKERVMLEINDRKDLLDEHKKVDRIIASRQGERTEENPSGSEYYVKWRGLGYEDSTWEAAATLTDDQGEIDAFLDRSNSQMVPSRSKQYRPDSRPPYKIFRSASDFLKGGELRDFQTLGVNWMADLWHRNMNGILADEMGLGKTVQTVSFLSYLFHKMHIYGPFLVVVPLGTISNWYRECAKWAPDMNVIVYQGNARGRDILRQEEFYSYVHCKGKAPKKILKFNVLLTTYEMVIMDKSHLSRIKWAFLAVDEAHRLKNDQSKLHQALAKEYTTGNRMLITGTPLQNNVQELLALIKFLMPAWKLDKDLEIDINDTESEEQQARIKELHGMLTQVMLRRLKKDVEQSLPGKTEMILRVPMSDLQKRYYTAIFTKNFKGLKAMKPDGTTSTSDVHISLQNVVMELKKVSNHPFLFPNARQFTSNRNDALAQLVVTSGKMALLDKLLTRMKAEGRRVLIFSQMVNMLNIMAEYLTMRGLHFQRLDGTVPSEARKRAMDHFNAPGSTDFAFLLSTRAGGLGLNLETADTVILFDLDWNPQNDLQAIARAHRIGQKRHVNVYRFVTAGSIEEDIVERAKRKMVLEYAIIQQMEKGVETKNMADELGKPTKDELATILKFGAKKLFEGDEPGSEPGQADEDKMAKLDLDDILARAEQTDLAQAQGVSGGSDEFMARWNTMNVEMDQLAWDEIVPESEVETRLKEAEALLGDAKKPEVPRKRLKVTGVSDSADEDASKEATKQDKKKSTKRKPPAERKVEPEDDPTEMDKKNISDLYGAIMTWGALDTRYDEMIQQAGLAHKSPDAIREAYEGILEACRVAVKEAGFDLANVKTPEKERAVYAEYQGVKELNGRKLLERIPLLQTLYDEMQAQRNILNYRIESSDLKTTAKWHSEPKWGMRDDAMLLVGTYRHGFGNYRAMQADSELGFQKKFFLGGERSAEKEDKKLPKKLHLDRRVISLLHSIRDQHLVSSPVRPKSKLKREREPEVEVRGPNKKRRSVGASERDNVRGVSPVRRKGTPTRSATNAKEKTVRQASPKNDRHSNHDPVLFKDYEGKLGTYKEMLRPVKTQLKACRDAPDFEKLYPPERQHKERVQWQLHTAQTQFKVVAELIESYVQEHRSRSARERLQAHLLRFVAENFFWKQPDGEPETWYNLKRLWEGIRSREVQEHNHKKVRSSPEVLSDIGGSPASSNTPSPKRKRDEDETLENKKPKREGSGSGGGGSGATPSGAGGAAAGKEGSKNGLTGYKIPKKKMVERP